MKIMKLKDITKTQAIEIAKLVYGFSDWITSDKFEFKYQPYDETWYEDACELVRINFEAIVFGDKSYPIQVEIGIDLNCYIYYLDGHLKSLPIRNQYLTQKKFQEYGIEPTLKSE
jgi:hypothetical protein